MGIAALTRAQTGQFFDADRLLPSSFISQVFTDRDGFVWSTTRHGIGRHDGYQVRFYLKKQNKGQASDYVNCMAQDSNGIFYFGMYGAWQSYDGSQFHDITVFDIYGNEVPCYVTSILELRSGKMIAGTSGHGVLMLTKPGEAHQADGVLSDIHTVRDMMEDSHKRLWIATDDQGLLTVTDDCSKTVFHLTPQQIGFTVNCICEDHEGHIYIGTEKHGVLRIENGTLQPVKATEGKTVTALFCTHDNRLVIGYDGNGISILNPLTGEVTNNPYYCREVELSLGKVVSITEDKTGNLWFGLLHKGVYMQPAQLCGFNYMGYKMGTHNTIGQSCVICTLIDSQRNTWVGSDIDGLYMFDSSHQLRKNYKQGFPQTVLTLREDAQGRIWTGNFLEGCGWIGQDGNYHKVDLDCPPGTSVFGIVFDRQGDTWLGTMGSGLLRRSTDGQVKSYTMQDMAAIDRQVNSLVNNYISKLALSPDGQRLYVSTTMGICCYDIAHNSWTSTFGGNCLNYGTAVRIAKEDRGLLWIGTYGPLLSYDLKTHKTDTVSNIEGVASIEFDKEGCLWLGTDHGMFQYNPTNRETRSFFSDNGLQGNEFCDDASCTAQNGKMLFGGIGGITWFDPQSLKDVPLQTTVKLTGFFVNGESIDNGTTSGGYEVCDTAVIAANNFELQHSDNTFTIVLSTLTYDTPDHITYIYSINDEPEVRLMPGQNEIAFSHLPPGKYHFSIKAERNSQQTEPRTFTVTVHAPWWRTCWAYCAYILMAALALWQYLKMRRRKEQDRLLLQEHIHAEEMGEAKLKFFMNISHEIRTPMTLILTPLLSLINSDDDPARRGIYDTILRNAERILHLINQMMDLRKIDKGMMQMHMQQTDLVSFIADIHTLFEQQAKAKHINLSFSHDDESLMAWIDRQNFDKVIVNILSNAFKFTPAGGTIDIRLSHDDKNACIAVSDNGENIPEEKLGKIFERFYQTETSAKRAGTGIGLDLTRSLVELHYGTITARNLDKGVVFSVSIPLGSDHLKPEEMMADNSEQETATDIMDDMTGTITTQQPLPAKGNCQRPVVVIAEDDDEIRNYLKGELETDYDVRACANGRIALGEIYGSMPDIVVSDVMMPEMDGNMLCTRIKQNPAINHIPVILLTARTLDEDRLQSLETGADAYIVKPFNMDILRRTMTNLINARRTLYKKYAQTAPLEQKAETVSIKSPDEKLMDRIMTSINKHLNDSDFSVDMIADEVGISRVHLYRKMKELTGQTPHDFIRQIKLKQAATLLASKKMNISEVVYACGFSNAASFSTMFKSVYGISPREYMNQHR